MGRNCRSFGPSASGQATILFALMIVPVILAAGAAIDYVMANRARTQLQAALDAAAMAVATATDQSLDGRKTIGLDYFRHNVEGTQLAEVKPEITINGDVINVKASYNFPTSFMSLAGINWIDIDKEAQVAGAASGNAEVALVLDYSKSMEDNDKYIRMRDAAMKMIDDLQADKGNGTLKVGLVPFSSMVRTTMPAAYVTQSSATETWTGCTQDRKYPYNIGVSTPTASADTKWGYIESGGQNAAPLNCPAYTAKKIEILPLTEDMSAVKTRLDDMVPIGYTNIPLGAEFGWNLLDPEEPFADGAAYDDAETKKFIVILTDGVQTTAEWGANGKRSVDEAKDNLLSLCSGMADKGITIFTIAYDVKAKDVTKLLKACAGDNYFQPENGADEIMAVFNAISQRIRKVTLRISR
jgi:Flp pilus assembly protein TadG